MAKGKGKGKDGGQSNLMTFWGKSSKQSEQESTSAHTSEHEDLPMPDTNVRIAFEDEEDVPSPSPEDAGSSGSYKQSIPSNSLPSNTSEKLTSIYNLPVPERPIRSKAGSSTATSHQSRSRTRSRRNSPTIIDITDDSSKWDEGDDVQMLDVGDKKGKSKAVTPVKPVHPFFLRAKLPPPPPAEIIEIRDDTHAPHPPPLLGSQNAPIELPPSPERKMAPLLPPKRKRRESVEAPWPTAETQHIKGPQNSFDRATSSSNWKNDSHKPGIISPRAPRAPIPLLQSPPPSSSPVEPVVDEEQLTEIPFEHIRHPAISRLRNKLFQQLSPPDKDHDVWMEKWKPTRASEVLGNEGNAHYLKAWLQALEVFIDTGKSTPAPEDKKQPKSLKRRAIVRAVDKSQRKKKRRSSYDDDEDMAGWVVDDDEIEDELVLDDDDPDSLIPPSAFSKALLRASVPRTFEDSPTPYNFDFTGDTLTNTIVLSGPSGVGKTASVYACAAELGWEVLEMYPGMGKRSGAAIGAVGEGVARNHVLGKGKARAGELQKGNIKALFDAKKNKDASAVGTPDEPIDLEGPDEDAHMSFAEDLKRSVGQTIILLEEVDILFREESSFWAAVINLIKESRRPVVLTCNDVSLVPLDDLPLQSVLKFEPCEAELATSYLQSLCEREVGSSPRRRWLRELYASTYQPIDADILDQPVLPFPSQSWPVPDLRRAISFVQFWASHEPPKQEDNDPGSLGNNWSWSCNTDEPEDSEETNDATSSSLSLIASFSDELSYANAYLERRPWDALEADSIDRRDGTSDDEIGHTLLAKPDRLGESGVGLAAYNEDDEIAKEHLHYINRLFSRKLKAPVQRGTTPFSPTSLSKRREDHQIQVATFLDPLIPLNAPLLPRQAQFLDYIPYIRIMVNSDDVQEAAVQNADEEEIERLGGRRTRGGRPTRHTRRLEAYIRYVTLDGEQLEAVRESRFLDV